MPLSLTTELQYIKGKVDPRLADALGKIVDAINGGLAQVGVDPVQTFQTPPAVQALNVSQQNGIFSASITDNSAILKPINYFLEYSTDPSFTNGVRVEHLGPARTKDLNLGAQTLHFRAYSQYQGSAASAHIYAIQNPVAGAEGALAPPPPPASTGSGTGSSTGNQAGTGFGPSQARAPQFNPSGPPTGAPTRP